MCSEPLIPPHGGYRELKSYQMVEIIYDVAAAFSDRRSCTRKNHPSDPHEREGCSASLLEERSKSRQQHR